jgi:hypothetical protein
VLQEVVEARAEFMNPEEQAAVLSALVAAGCELR